MSLNQIMNSGVTGMLSHQKALNVTSNNIANVQTDGYARKTVDYSTIVLGGYGAGVDVEDVRRVTDEFIQRELRLSTASAEQFNAMSQIYGKLQALLGDPSANTSLTGKVDSIHTSFSALTVDPTLSVSRTAALTELSNFGTETNRLLTQIQSLRKEADTHIASEIETVNAAILRIHELNKEISSATISEKPTGELEDKRDQAIDEISKIMDVKTYPQGNNSVAVVTNAGQQLLDFTPRQLVYSPAATVSSATIFDQISLNVYDEVTGTIASTGLPLDPELTGGSLRGWLDMRNVELPALADQIGTLAAATAEQFNAVHNANTAVPPPAALTGHNSGLAAAEAHGFTGEATFYSFDANNDIVASYTVDFDAVGTNTLADVVAEVNGALGAGTLSLTNGVMSMNATGGATGVGISQDATDPALRAGRGFSHFFGMNDLVEARVPTNFDTGLALGDNHSFTGTTEFSFRGPDGQVQSSFTVDFGAIGGTMADVINEINANISPAATASLTASGAISINNAAGYESYKINVVNDTSDRSGTGKYFSEMFGVGLSYPSDQAVDFSVREDIEASPMKMALAEINPTGTPALNLSDNRGALKFQDLSSATNAFGTVGELPGSVVTVAEYAAQILAKSGLDAARADSLQQDRSTLAGVLNEKLQEAAGVNMDEELANLIVYQNAYNAAARVITTARDMYDVLLNIV
ncbi:MAG: flagellar hook-associated protein FlgK [Sneathiella sp.]|nr:flagellar hook-associated protein FlgK [Sneathiella sp.]